MNKSYTAICMSSHDLLEICAIRANACCKCFTPMVNSRVDNVLAPDLNQPLFQFIKPLDVCTVNAFRNGRPYLIVNWVKI